jgi:hypothetical protein
VNTPLLGEPPTLYYYTLYTLGPRLIAPLSSGFDWGLLQLEWNVLYYSSTETGRADMLSLPPSAGMPDYVNFHLVSALHPIHIHPLSAVLTTLTHRISHPRILTTATGPHVMSSATDLESGQGAQAAPRAGAFRSLSHHCPLGQKC